MSEGENYKEVLMWIESTDSKRPAPVHLLLLPRKIRRSQANDHPKPGELVAQFSDLTARAMYSNNLRYNIPVFSWCSQSPLRKMSSYAFHTAKLFTKYKIHNTRSPKQSSMLHTRHVVPTTMSQQYYIKHETPYSTNPWMYTPQTLHSGTYEPHPTLLASHFAILEYSDHELFTLSSMNLNVLQQTVQKVSKSYFGFH